MEKQFTSPLLLPEPTSAEMFGHMVIEQQCKLHRMELVRQLCPISKESPDAWEVKKQRVVVSGLLKLAKMEYPELQIDPPESVWPPDKFGGKSGGGAGPAAGAGLLPKPEPDS